MQNNTHDLLKNEFNISEAVLNLVEECEQEAAGKFSQLFLRQPGSLA